MDLEATKLEVIELLLNTKEETILKKVKQLLEEDEKKDGFTLTEEHYRVLDERRKRHFAGESKSYTLKEVKENMKKTVQDAQAKYKKRSSD